MKYYLLNVFSKGQNSGNQLAVVFQDGHLDFDQMLSIAKDFNFSETVFVEMKSSEPNIRIFTPKEELPFAGHPTVGTGWLLHHLKLVDSTFSMKAKLGMIPVVANADGSLITFPGEPKIHEYEGNIARAITACHISVDSVDHMNCRVVNVGPEFLILPVKDQMTLTQAALPGGSPLGIRLYLVHETSPQTYNVRMFGYKEDAATGSAACALAGYLKFQMKREKGSLTVFQGAEINRPSCIQLQWNESIQVGGKVTLWGEGNLYRSSGLNR